MPKGLEDRELEGLSDEELAALEDEDVGSLADATRAAKGAELPDDGNKDDADADGADDDDAGDDDAGDAGANAAAGGGGADADAGGDDDGAGEDPPAGLRLTPPSLEGHDEQINQLLDQRKAIRAQYREGDLTAEEKDAKEDELNDKIADLRAAKQNAAFVENFNNQAAETEYVKTIDAVKASVREKDGIDYDKNPLLLQRWDLKVRELAADQKNAHRTGRWFLEEAHKVVLAEVEAAAQALGFERGKGGKPLTADAKIRDAINKRKPGATGAKSLATLPMADQDTGHSDGEFSHLDALDGDDLEVAVARMSPEQQERWARS
jgi:hypothetical protein